MTGRVLPFPGGLRRSVPRVTAIRARITRAGFREDDLRWILSCSCGWGQIEHAAGEATRAKRAHDAEHRRAEAAHPAGKGLPGGGGPA